MNIENLGKDFKNSTPESSAGFWQEFDEMVTEHENSKNVEMERGVVGQIGMKENKLTNSRSIFTLVAGFIIFTLLGAGVWLYVQNSTDSEIASINTTAEEDKANLSLLDALGAEAYIYQTDEAEPSELIYVVDDDGTKSLTDMGDYIDGYFVTDSFLIRDVNGLPVCEDGLTYSDGTAPVAIEQTESFIKVWFEDRSLLSNNEYPGVDEFEIPSSPYSCTTEETVSDIGVGSNLTTVRYLNKKLIEYSVRDVNSGLKIIYNSDDEIIDIRNLDGVSLTNSDLITNFEPSEDGILIYESNNKVFATDGATGDQLWSFDEPGRLAGLADNVLVLVSDGSSEFSDAVVLDTETGKIIKRFNNFENDVIAVVRNVDVYKNTNETNIVSELSDQEISACTQEYDRVSNLDRETMSALEFDISDIFQSTEGSSMTVYYEDGFPTIFNVKTFGEIGRVETFYEIYNDDDYGFRRLNYRYNLPFDDTNAKITEDSYKTCQTNILPDSNVSPEISEEKTLADLIMLVQRAENISEGAEVG